MKTDLSDTPTIPEIDQVILIDRSVDFVTPLATQLTYEGLVDEIFSVVNGTGDLLLLEKSFYFIFTKGFIDVEPAIVGDSKNEAKSKKIAMNANDAIYRQLRDLNFSSVPQFLSKKTKEISYYYEQRKEIANLTPSALQEFVKQFKEARQSEASVTVHSGLTEAILSKTDSNFYNTISTEQDLLAGEASGSDFIEECIDKQEPIIKVLRLLCMQSLTSGGLKAKEFDFFRKEILQTYGYQYLPTLTRLEKLGLLKVGTSGFTGAISGSWSTLKRSLNLIVNAVEKNMSDFAYVYSVYAPLSVRLLQAAFKQNGWKSKEDVFKLLNCPVTEESQSAPVQKSSDQKVTLVYFVGGVTFAEISAIKWLSDQDGYGHFVIGTTKLINGNTFIKSFMDNE